MMNASSIPVEEFTEHMDRLGSAFGRVVSESLILEFYQVFSSLSPQDFAALVDWAIRSLDAPFPSIARLRKGAVELGFFKREAEDAERPRPPRTPDVQFEYFICPECEGTFVVFKTRLPGYAREGKVFDCVNRLYYGCPIRFQVREGEAGPQVDFLKGEDK